MEIKYWAGTDVGRKRSDNEDNFLIDKRLRLFVVADGMGGHASGEIASAMAVHGIREVLNQERDILDVYDDDDPKSHVEVCTLLEYAVHYTCAQIHQKARREPEKRGMGTTLVVLLVIGARGFIAYVGDSRIYLLRGGVVYQLTEDHSLRNELIRMGKITADEFESSPYANLKNAMTRAVGVYESVEVDTLDFDIIPGDAFLLCSDGLYEYLTDDDIAHALALPEIREVPGMLIDAANSRGGKDNITAVVVQVAGGADDKDRAAELNFTLDTLKNVPLFRELSYQQLVRVINLSRQSALEPGEVLCREGEPGHELMVVLRGRVELTQGGVRVAELGAGSHLGEMSLIDEGLRSVTAIALDPGKVLAIGRDDFYEVLRREPALAVKLLWSFVRVLAGRLRATTADLAVARTSAAQVMPDLTDLAEETTRAMARAPTLVPTVLPPLVLDEFDEDETDDEEDELERRPTMISGMLRPPAASLESRPTLVSTTTKTPEEVAAGGDGSVMSSARSRPRSGPIATEGAPASRGRPSSSPAITGDTVAAPAPRPPGGPGAASESGASPTASSRISTMPAITGDTVAAPPPVPRPRTSSSPAITGVTLTPGSEPRPAGAGTGASPGDGVATPHVPRQRTSSNPGITGATVAPPPAASRPRPAGGSGEPATSAKPSAASPAGAGSGDAAASSSATPAAASGEAGAKRSGAGSSPAPGERAPSRPVRGTNPILSGELLPARSAGDGATPPAAAPRSRRAPEVTKANESSWSPALRPMGTPVVPSPQAPTAPLDAPHLLAPPAESDAPKTRRTGRRSTLPHMPGTPLTPTPPPVAAPSPLHAAPTAPLAAPVMPQPAGPTAPLAAPIIAPLAASSAPLGGSVTPAVPPLAAPAAARGADGASARAAGPSGTDGASARAAGSSGTDGAFHRAAGSSGTDGASPRAAGSSGTDGASPRAAGSSGADGASSPRAASPSEADGAPLRSRREEKITAPGLPVIQPPPPPAAAQASAASPPPPPPPVAAQAHAASPPPPPPPAAAQAHAASPPPPPPPAAAQAHAASPPPPPPARGGTMPPTTGRGTTMPTPPRTDADSDAPRVPAPRHAGATPQAGGTQPPPSADGAAGRAQTNDAGSPAVPPPPPTRKGDPDDPATPAAEPGA